MYVHTYIYTYRRTSVAFVYHEYMCMCNVCGVYDCRSTMVIRLNFPLYPTSPIYQYLLLSSKRLLRVRRRRAEYGWRWSYVCVCASQAGQEAIYLGALLRGFNFQQTGAMEIWEGNASCVMLRYNIGQRLLCQLSYNIGQRLLCHVEL